MPIKLLVALIATTIIFLVLGISGWYYPSYSPLLLGLVIAVCAWVLSLSFVALFYLNREVDESDIKKSRG
jgi:Zn-dependent protease with chaperone function